MTPPRGSGTLIAGVLIFMTSMIALVVLIVTGHDNQTDDVLTLAGPVVAALLIAGHQTSENKSQNVVLDQIASQTNGTLDARIRAQTTAALVEAGVVQSPVTIAAPTERVVAVPALTTESGSSSESSSPNGVVG